MEYFTAYWKNATWDRKAAEAARGRPNLEYAASNQFEGVGVEPGSTVIIITVIKGELFIAGRIKVNKVLTSRAAAAAAVRRPENEIWEGSHYIVPAPGDIDVFRGDISVPMAISASLEFESKAGISRPKLLPNGKLDQQTLRNVRRLYPGAEGPLLAAIGL